MYQKYLVKLTSEDRQNLEKSISCGEAPARKLRRARILLKSDCSENGPKWTYEAICNAFDVNSLTVTHVRKAYVEGGLEMALNRKPPDREYELSIVGLCLPPIVGLCLPGIVGGMFTTHSRPHVYQTSPDVCLPL